jgi:hypothetical protein
MTDRREMEPDIDTLYEQRWDGPVNARPSYQYRLGLHAAANIARSHGSQAQTTEDGQ